MTHNCRCLFLEARKSPTNQRLRMHNPWTFTIWPFKTNSYNWPSQRLSTIISSENNIEYTMCIKKSFEILSRHKTGAPPIQWTTPQDQLPNPSTSLNNSAIRGTCEVGHATCRGQPTKKKMWEAGEKEDVMVTPFQERLMISVVLWQLHDDATMMMIIIVAILISIVIN